MSARLPAACAALILAACNNSGSNGRIPPPPPPQFAAEVTRTSYGVVHVKADDFSGVGYGPAYCCMASPPTRVPPTTPTSCRCTPASSCRCCPSPRRPSAPTRRAACGA